MKRLIWLRRGLRMTAAHPASLSVPGRLRLSLANHSWDARLRVADALNATRRLDVIFDPFLFSWPNILVNLECNIQKLRGKEQPQTEQVWKLEKVITPHKCNKRDDWKRQKGKIDGSHNIVKATLWGGSWVTPAQKWLRPTWNGAEEVTFRPVLRHYHYCSHHTGQEPDDCIRDCKL